MEYEIKDEEFLEEVEKLPQLDRIEFRQKRIHFINLNRFEHLYNDIVFNWGYISSVFLLNLIILGVALGNIDEVLAFFLTLGVLIFLTGGSISCVINRRKGLKKIQKDINEWTNKYFKFTKR